LAYRAGPSGDTLMPALSAVPSACRLRQAQVRVYETAQSWQAGACRKYYRSNDRHRSAQIDTHVKSMLHSATTFLKMFASTVLIGVGGLLAYQILGSLTSFGPLLFAAVLTVVTALLLRG